MNLFDGTSFKLAITLTTSLFLISCDGSGELLSTNTNTNKAPTWQNAEASITRHIIRSQVDGARDVDYADIDDDGDLDILLAPDNDVTVAWYENDGAIQPTFTAHAISTVGREAHAVLAVDIDGDGDLDVIATEDNTVAWHENNGAALPSFTEHVITTHSKSQSVAVTDIDGDGDLDLLSAYENGVAWLDNNGAAQPNFTAHQLSFDTPALSVTTADMDDDGDMDVLYVSEGFEVDTFAWLENDGQPQPGFTEHVITTEPEPAFTGDLIRGTVDGAQSITAADIDGDGDIDALLASRGGSTLAWYENDGEQQPSFTKTTIAAVTGGTRFVTTADMDGDGDLDLVSASQQSDTAAWYENDGAAQPKFAAHVISTISHGATSVAIADINGDGSLDVLSSSEFGGTLAWHTLKLKQQGFVAEGATYSAAETATAADSGPLTYAISHGADAAFFSIDSSTGEVTFNAAPATSAPGDENEDNVYEVWISVTDGLFTLNRALAVTVYVDDGDIDDDGVADMDDAFPYDPRETTDTDGDGIGNNADADDDGDSVPDAEDNAPLENGGYNAPVWLNADIAQMRHVIRSRGAATIFSADIDSDGDLDVLTVTKGLFSPTTIAWHENNGTARPTFIEHEILVEYSLGAVTIEDINGDGHLDVLVVASSNVAWLENDGANQPSFTKHTINTDSKIQSVTAVDMDGDGDLDLRYTLQVDNAVFWYENDGTAQPSFTTPVTSAANEPRFATTVDLDGDGDLDLLSPISSEDTVAWYESDGADQPSFTLHTITTAASLVASVTAADMDGDGDLDVLSVSRGDSTLSWFENDGAAQPKFKEHVITNTFRGHPFISTADIDNDGDLDVIAGIAWYENNGAARSGFTPHPIAATDITPQYRFGLGWIGVDANGAIAIPVDIDGDGDLEILSTVRSDFFLSGVLVWRPTTQANYSVVENENIIITELASDIDGDILTYDIASGADAAHFTITPLTGELSFTAPPVASPQDANGNNVYEVWISVTDGISTLNRAIAVKVTRQ